MPPCPSEVHFSVTPFAKPFPTLREKRGAYRVLLSTATCASPGKHCSRAAAVVLIVPLLRSEGVSMSFMLCSTCGTQDNSFDGCERGKKGLQFMAWAVGAAQRPLVGLAASSCFRHASNLPRPQHRDRMSRGPSEMRDNLFSHRAASPRDYKGLRNEFVCELHSVFLIVDGKLMSVELREPPREPPILSEP